MCASLWTQTGTHAHHLLQGVSRDIRALSPPDSFSSIFQPGPARQLTSFFRWPIRQDHPVRSKLYQAGCAGRIVSCWLGGPQGTASCNLLFSPLWSCCGNRVSNSHLDNFNTGWVISIFFIVAHNSCGQRPPHVLPSSSLCSVRLRLFSSKIWFYIKGMVWYLIFFLGGKKIVVQR